MSSRSTIGKRAHTLATLKAGLVRYCERECGFAADRPRHEAESASKVVARYGEHSIAGIVDTDAQVRAALDEVRQRLGRTARVRVVTDRVLDVGPRITHAQRFLKGFRANAAAISALGSAARSGR